VLIASLVGYFLFLLKYPDKTYGITIKATYIIQAYLMLPFFTAGILTWLAERSRWVFWLLLGGTGLVFLHNIPSMITHFPLFGY
jgi:hypothetical protein